MSHKWTCPLCEEVDGKFERQTKLGLDMAVAAHILRHEHAAELRAVDRARKTCQSTDCSIGRNKFYDSASADFSPRLTDYDKKFLEGVRIKLDG